MHKKHAILHTSQAKGGARAPPLATLLDVQNHMSMPQVHNAKMKLLLCQLLIMSRSPNLWHQQAQTHHNHLQFLSS